MVTALEHAIWAISTPLRETRFANILRNARVSSRSSSLPGPDDQLQGWELSFDPAVHRTLGATLAVGMMKHEPPDTSSEWMRWKIDAKRAMSRLTSKCWAGIDARHRATFIDEDDFHPLWGHSYVQNLRQDTPGRHLNFEGLFDGHVRELLRDIYLAARQTPAYDAVKLADQQLTRSPKMRREWERLADAGRRDLDKALRELVVQDGKRRGPEILRKTYEGTSVETVASAFRNYNRLVHRIVWSILGLAEVTPSPFVLTDPVGTIRCTVDANGEPFISTTSTDAGGVILRVTHPIWLETGTPLDGLHNVIGLTMRFASGAATDLHLTPLRHAAGEWPK